MWDSGFESDSDVAVALTPSPELKEEPPQMFPFLYDSEGNVTSRKPDPKSREVQIPIFISLGKGWNPQECDSESDMMRRSCDFLRLMDEKNFDAAVKCLEYRLDLDLVDEGGECALHKAIKNQHEGLTRFLLGQGADVDSCDDDGFNSLHYAVYYDDIRLTLCLLTLHVNLHKLTKDGFNVMHYCAARGNVQLAKLLVEKNVDFTCKAKDGTRPVDYARNYNKQEMVDYLEEQERIQKVILMNHMKELEQEEMRLRASSFYGSRLYSPRPQRRNDGPRKIIFAGLSDEEYDYDENSHSFDRTALEVTECMNCSALEDSDLTYCSSCNWILGDQCPDCGEKDIEQRSYCKSCHRPFWGFDDETLPPSNTYKLCPYCNAQQEDDNLDYCSSCCQPLGSRKRKVPETLQCPVCGVNQYDGNDYCVDCGYTMSNVCHSCGTLQFDCGSETCYSCFSSLYDPSRMSASTVYDVECVKCKTISNGVQNEYCELCHYALHNICPDCLYSPIDGADMCTRCGKDLWDNC